MTATERDTRDIRTADQNRKDLSALLELRDIIDELGTIMKLLDQQKVTVGSMIRYYDDKVYGRSFLDKVLDRLDEYGSRVLEMKKNARLAQKAVCSCYLPFNLSNRIGRNTSRSQTETGECR